MTITNVAGLVLAGGQSSRMGTDKSKLLFQNKTLLEKACLSLRAAGINTILISGKHAGYDCIEDEWPNAGPAAAILSAIMHASLMRVDYLIVMAVDMPLLSSAVLLMLKNSMDDDLTEVGFIKDNPFPCCIKTAALKRVGGDYHAQPAISMWQLLTEKLHYKALDIPEEMGQNLININTPEAFSKLRADYET